MEPSFWPEWVTILIMMAPFVMALYLGLRYVRSLENRKGSSVMLADLTAEVKSLRSEMELMSDDLAQLESDQRPDDRIKVGRGQDRGRR